MPQRPPEQEPWNPVCFIVSLLQPWSVCWHLKSGKNHCPLAMFLSLQANSWLSHFLSQMFSLTNPFSTALLLDIKREEAINLFKLQGYKIVLKKVLSGNTGWSQKSGFINKNKYIWDFYVLVWIKWTNIGTKSCSFKTFFRDLVFVLFYFALLLSPYTSFMTNLKPNKLSKVHFALYQINPRTHRLPNKGRDAQTFINKV